MNREYVFAFSEQGYNHIKADKICQDSSGYYSDEHLSIIVVADGHGSNNYPRTNRGSEFAVESALKSIKEFVYVVKEQNIDIFSDSDEIMGQLSKSILLNWYNFVEADYTSEHFSEDELLKVSDKYRKKYNSGKCFEKAYGTTLIAVCSTDEYWFGLQIGDGKCVCILPDGTAVEPIPWDNECQSNVTTSMCDDDASDEFRFFISKEKPIAIIIGSDGIDDSYVGNEELHNLYMSVLSIFAEHGEEIGKKEIEEFLPQISRKGSGDDVSIAGIISSEIMQSFIPVIKTKCEYEKAKSLQEQAKRNNTAAKDYYSYIENAVSKVKSNLEDLELKMKNAEENVAETNKSLEEAFIRLKEAENAYFQAERKYHCT